jgi:hypothetical protein
LDRESGVGAGVLVDIATGRLRERLDGSLGRLLLGADREGTLQGFPDRERRAEQLSHEALDRTRRTCADGPEWEAASYRRLPIPR